MLNYKIVGENCGQSKNSLLLFFYGEANVRITNRAENMSKYQANITKNADGAFYALIVRVDMDGQTQVIHGYKGRNFSTLKAAEKSTSAYLAKIGA